MVRKPLTTYTDYERTQEVAGRFRRVLVSRKIRGLRVGADPSGGTGRYGHGDWMETDRCIGGGSDLLIPRAARVRGDADGELRGADSSFKGPDRRRLTEPPISDLRRLFAFRKDGSVYACPAAGAAEGLLLLLCGPVARIAAAHGPVGAWGTRMEAGPPGGRAAEGEVGWAAWHGHAGRLDTQAITPLARPVVRVGAAGRSAGRGGSGCAARPGGRRSSR